VTQINLPNKSVTGTNFWSQVEDNDQVIADVVNGDLDASNLADGAVTTAKIGDSQVTTDKINNGAVTKDKIPAPTVGVITYNSGYSAITGSPDYSPLTIAKTFDGLVSVFGGVQRTCNFSLTGLVGTFPEGFRPAGPVLLLGLIVFGGMMVGFQLLANGELRTLYSTPSATSGAGIIAATFHAA